MGVKLLVSVAELLPGAGSVTPFGTAMVAVFESVIGGVPMMIPDTVKTTAPLTGRSIVKAVMSPLAFAGQFGASHVQCGLTSPLGSWSFTLAPVTADGPAFRAVIV